MKFHQTALPGVIHIEPDLFADARGVFLETYHQEKYTAAGLPSKWVQNNISKSVKGVLRGLHAQLNRPQAKLVQVLLGEIWDVAVDIRPGSPTYKKWIGITLCDKSMSQLYIPAGFAHGFCTLSENAIVEYKCGDVYDPQGELHLLWNDPELGIQWPIQNPLLSPKDQQGVSLRQIESKLVELSAK